MFEEEFLIGNAAGIANVAMTDFNKFIFNPRLTHFL